VCTLKCHTFFSQNIGNKLVLMCPIPTAEQALLSAGRAVSVTVLQCGVSVGPGLENGWGDKRNRNGGGRKAGAGGLSAAEQRHAYPTREVVPAETIAGGSLPPRVQVDIFFCNEFQYTVVV
jgi:hypothetical protein